MLTLALLGVQSDMVCFAFSSALPSWTPDTGDEWNYPDRKMWVDWVKFWTLDDLTADLPDDLGYECRANPESSIEELCGSANWACFNQQHVQMTVCGDDNHNL